MGVLQLHHIDINRDIMTPIINPRYPGTPMPIQGILQVAVAEST